MRDISPLMVAAVSFGLVVGAAIAQVGLGIAESAGMSIGTYGASAQLAAALLWGSGTPLVVVVGTALVINARFFVYSASFAPLLESESVPTRLLAGYLMRDGAYALAMAKRLEDDELDVVPYYLGAASLDWVVWLLSTAAGTLGARFLPASWSLDFIVPLVFIALLANAARTRRGIEVAVVSALAGAALIPVLPLQTGIIAAIALGMGWGAIRGPQQGSRT